MSDLSFTICSILVITQEFPPERPLPKSSQPVESYRAFGRCDFVKAAIVPVIKQPGKIIRDSSELLRWVKQQYPERALIAFSRGKDSIAAWLELRKHWDEIVPLFWYAIPDLEFELESLDYFERFFGTKIHRFPNPNLNRMLNNLTFQPPEHCETIERFDLPLFTREDTWRDLCEDLAIPLIPNATGVRATDSPLRRMAYEKHGLWRPKSEAYMPVGDWNKARTMEAITRAGVKLPVDYQMFKRSFDGLDYRFVGPLKRHRPRDYAKILEWFPMVEADVFRHERMGFRA